MPLAAPKPFTVRGVYGTSAMAQLDQKLGRTVDEDIGLRAPQIDVGRLPNLGGAYKFIAAWKAVQNVPIPRTMEAQQRRQLLNARAVAAASTAQMQALFPKLSGSDLHRAIVETARPI